MGRLACSAFCLSVVRLSLLRDEKGSVSSARCAFWVNQILLTFVVLVDLSGVAVGNVVYATLSTVFLACASWAAGPRIAQYLAPQISASAKAIGEAFKRRNPAEGHEETR